MTYALWAWMLRGSASHEIAAEPPEERFQNVAAKLVADKFSRFRYGHLVRLDPAEICQIWPCKFKYGK